MMAAPKPEPALAQLSRRYRPPLMSFFLRRVRHHAEAEDLTQEVFARLAAGAPPDLRSAEAYVFQVAANLLRDRARREKVRADYLEGLRTAEMLGVDPIDPGRQAEGRRSMAVFAERLKELPLRTRTMFLLFRMENTSKKAIADSYGVSLSTVEKEIAKAMAYLTLCRELDE